MALTLPGLVIVVSFLSVFYLRTTRQLRILDLESRSPLYSHFLETLEGITSIRAFGWTEAFKQKFREKLDTSQKPFYLMYCCQRWLNLVLSLIITAMAVIVVAMAIELRSTTNGGLLGIALNSVVVFNQSLQELIAWWTQLEISLGAIQRVKSFNEDTPNEAKPGEDVEQSPHWPERGTIIFQDVCASYKYVRRL